MSLFKKKRPKILGKFPNISLHDYKIQKLRKKHLGFLKDSKYLKLVKLNSKVLENDPLKTNNFSLKILGLIEGTENNSFALKAETEECLRKVVKAMDRYSNDINHYDENDSHYSNEYIKKEIDNVKQELAEIGIDNKEIIYLVYVFKQIMTNPINKSLNFENKVELVRLS